MKIRLSAVCGLPGGLTGLPGQIVDLAEPLARRLIEMGDAAAAEETDDGKAAGQRRRKGV